MMFMKNYLFRLTFGLLCLGVFNTLQPSMTSPVGLNNLGNTCYMNSGLQLLSCLQGLNDRIVANAHAYKKGSITEDYLAFLHGARQMTAQRQLVSGFTNDPTQANDAHEFAGHLLDRFSQADFLEEGNYVDAQASIRDLFSARVRTSYSEGTDPLREKIEPYPTIEVAIDGNSLQACIDSFTIPSVLEDSYFIYKADGRTVEREIKGAIEKNSFVDVPRYLFIQLKRIGFNKATNKTFPINDVVSFPLMGLTIKTENGLEVYDLKAVTVHSGSATGGHYKAYSNYGDTWYECNDSLCNTKSIEEMRQIALAGGEGNFRPTFFVYEKSSFVQADREKKAQEAEEARIAAELKKKQETEKFQKKAAELRERTIQLQQLQQKAREEEAEAKRLKAVQEAADAALAKKLQEEEQDRIAREKSEQEAAEKKTREQAEEQRLKAEQEKKAREEADAALAQRRAQAEQERQQRAALEHQQRTQQAAAQAAQNRPARVKTNSIFAMAVNNAQQAKK